MPIATIFQKIEIFAFLNFPRTSAFGSSKSSPIKKAKKAEPT
jgi:hypothetical protein